jgi:hypothetical protein
LTITGGNNDAWFEGRLADLIRIEIGELAHATHARTGHWSDKIEQHHHTARASAVDLDQETVLISARTQAGGFVLPLAAAINVQINQEVSIYSSHTDAAVACTCRTRHVFTHHRGRRRAGASHKGSEDLTLRASQKAN